MDRAAEFITGMQPLVQPVLHRLPGMQHPPVGGSQYRLPHRTCCAASTGVKRKRERQQNQLAPAEAQEFLTWAAEAGVKADKLELAMFDGEALHSQTAQSHHSLQHAIMFPVSVLRSCPPQTLSCAVSPLLAARAVGVSNMTVHQGGMRRLELPFALATPESNAKKVDAPHRSDSANLQSSVGQLQCRPAWHAGAPEHCQRRDTRVHPPAGRHPGDARHGVPSAAGQAACGCRLLEEQPLVSQRSVEAVQTCVGDHGVWGCKARRVNCRLSMQRRCIRRGSNHQCSWRDRVACDSAETYSVQVL